MNNFANISFLASLTIFFVCQLPVYAQFNTGIYFSEICSDNDNNCVKLKLNSFYFNNVQSEYEVYVVKEGPGDGYEYASEHILELGEIKEICDLKSGLYHVRVLTTGNCEEIFEMPVGDISIYPINLTPLKSDCETVALHIDLPPSSSQVNWFLETSKGFEFLITNNGEDYIPDPLKWAPGVYIANFQDGCNGFKTGSHEVTCQIEGDVRSTDENLPTSCASQDGSLRIRTIEICTATNGETSMHLRNSAGQILLPNKWSIFTNLGSEEYTLVVEDEFGCSTDVRTFDFRVEDSDIEVDIEIADACYDTNNGEVEIWVGSENQNYTYSSNLPNLMIEPEYKGTVYSATNLAPSSIYEFVITSNEGCVFNYPIEIGERDENQYWRGSIRTDVTHGCNSGTLGSVDLYLGSIPLPATISWDGGPLQTINSANITKGGLSSGEHCIEITSYCGASTLKCFDIFNLENDLAYFLRVNENCRTEFRFDYQHPLTRMISSFTFGGQTYTDTRTSIIPLTDTNYELIVRFKNSSCVITKYIFTTGSRPIIELDPPCEDFEDGKITFRFTRVSDDVPSFEFDGNPVALDPSLDNYVVSFDGLIAPFNYSYKLVSGDCVIEDGIRLTGSGITTEVSGFDVGQQTCQYDVYCQGDLLEGRTWTSEMGNRIPFQSKGDKCETMFTCNGNDVDSEKVSMKTVSVGVYNRLLSTARASGIHFPADVNDNKWYNTRGMHGCDRVRYCPADMQIRSRYWSTFASNGRTIGQDPNTGCFTQDCPLFNSTGCLTEEYIPGGAIGPWQPPIDQGPCTEVKITLKQLVLWHDQLLLERPDYDDDPDGNNLYRLANEIFTDLGLDATYIPTSPATNGQQPYQDPLLCTNVIFCRETLEVRSFDNWRNSSICEPASGSTFSPYCVVPLPGSNFSSCDGQDGGFTQLLFTCKDEGTEFNNYTREFVIYERPIINTFSGCYPDEIFNLETYPRLSPPGKSEYYVLRPYFAERYHKSFATIVDQNGTKWSPKQFSNFGGYTSYSHNATQESESDLDFIPGTLAGSEHLTADDGFILSLHKNEESQGFYLLKDNQDSPDPLLIFEDNFVAYEAISNGFVMITASSVGIASYENLSLHRVSFEAGDAFSYDQQDLTAAAITSTKLHLANGIPYAILTSENETITVSGSSVSLGQTLQSSNKAYDEQVLAFPKQPTVSIAIDTSENDLLALRHLDSQNPLFLVSGENGRIFPLSHEGHQSRFLVSGAESISPYGSADVSTITLDESIIYEIVTSANEIISSAAISDLKGAILREVYHVGDDLFTAAIDLKGDQQGEYFDKRVINNSPFLQSVAIDFISGKSDADALRNRSSSITEFSTESSENTNFSWSLAPNPAGQYLNIRFKLSEEESNDANLSIVSSAGQRLIEQNIKFNGQVSKSVEIDISRLPPGTYIAQLISPKIGLEHKQFIVHR
jgi:hypothetical protein